MLLTLSDGAVAKLQACRSLLPVDCMRSTQAEPPDPAAVSEHARRLQPCPKEVPAYVPPIFESLDLPAA